MINVIERHERQELAGSSISTRKDRKIGHVNEKVRKYYIRSFMTVTRCNVSDVTRQLRKFENSGCTAWRPNSNKVTRYMLGRLQLTAIADANGIVMRNSDDRRDRRSKVGRLASLRCSFGVRNQRRRRKQSLE